MSNVDPKRTKKKLKNQSKIDFSQFTFARVLHLTRPPSQVPSTIYAHYILQLYPPNPVLHTKQTMRLSRLFSSVSATSSSSASWIPNASGLGWHLPPSSIPANATLFTYPALSDNYYTVLRHSSDSHVSYLVSDCPSASCASGLDDAFDSASSLPASVNVFLTHHHDDHTAGLPSITDFCAVKGLDLNVVKHSSPPPPQSSLPSGLSVEPLFTAGHTEDHTCFSIPSLNLLISGDALFMMGCGRVFTGDTTAAYEGLQVLKGSVAPEARVLCSHEYTVANGRFSLSLGADFWGDDWGRLQERVAVAEGMRERGEITIGGTFAEVRKRR